MEVIEEESHRNWLGRDFPGPVVNNPFSNAAGGGGGGSFNPWLGNYTATLEYLVLGSKDV